MLGATLGNYKLLQKLGEGGMGAVYLGEHQHIARRAAIKVLRQELSHHSGLVERLFIEARATSQIKHPGIVEVFDCGRSVEGGAGGAAYIVMELLLGEPLSRHLRRNGAGAQGEYVTAIKIGHAIAAAVGAAHAQGIVHRDLKPDNIFLARQGDQTTRVKILDFGIAKLAAGERLVRTSTGAIMGTPIYMSPEQCQSAREVDARADIYALGCVLYELVAGRPPFVKETPFELMAAHLSEIPAAPSTLARDVPAGLDQLVLAMLAKSPADRPAAMDEVARRLRALGGPASDAPLELALPPAPTLEPPGPTLHEPTVPESTGPDPMPAVTSILPPTLPSRTTLGASAHGLPIAPSSARSPRPRRSTGIVAAAGIVAAVVLAVLWTRSPPPNAPPAPPAPDRFASTPAPAPAPVPAPARVPAVDVVITLPGAPRGATAIVDGTAHPLPLRLQAGPPRQVRFQAPGYQPHTVTLDPGAGPRALPLEWRRARPTRGSSEKTVAPSSHREPEPAGANPLDMKLK